VGAVAAAPSVEDWGAVAALEPEGAEESEDAWQLTDRR
jgi:hypothetical protein